uniref:Uncharacterized protein n=1 Tax=Anopheles dirus TaxID=7168 RepID=A0A182NRC0_9DIPT
MELNIIGYALVLALLIHFSLQNTRSTEKPIERNTTRNKAYSIRITKYLCVGMPYERTTVNYCKTVLRRNQPTVLNVSVHVPEVLNYIWVTVKLYYKFRTFQPFLIDMEQEGCEYMKNRPVIPLTDYIYEIFQKSVPDLSSPCPHGNKTYNIVWWLEEKYTPKSIPAGDYRLDVQFIAHDKAIIYANTRSTEKPIGRNTTNNKPYTIRITKYLCVELPYERTTVSYCKTLLRRNQPTVLNVSVHVPEVLNYILVTVKLYYKFRTFQPLLIDMEQEGCEYMRNRPIIPLTDYIYEIYQKSLPDLAKPCPHGNRTYNIVWWLEEKHTPKSMPAGDYRLDTRLHLNRMLCVDMPYPNSFVTQCRVILRRNQMSLIALSIDVPDLYNYITLHVKLHYKFNTFQPLLFEAAADVCGFMRDPVKSPALIYVYEILLDMVPKYTRPCPHGNLTYAVLTEFKEEYAPKSVPAGDYRLDLRFATHANVTLLSVQLYFYARRREFLVLKIIPNMTKAEIYRDRMT